MENVLSEYLVKMYNNIRNIIACALFICAGIMTFFASCANEQHKYYNPNELVEYEALAPEDTLCGTRIASYYGLNAMGLNCCDSLLVITENPSIPHIFTILNTNTDSIVAQFGNLGHAKNEFISPPTNCYFEKNKNKDICMCFSDDGIITKVINLSKSVLTGTCVLETLIKQEYKSYDYFVLSNKRYFVRQGVGYEDARDNAFFSPKFVIAEKREQKEIGLYPMLISSSDFPVLMMAYGSTTKISPNKTKVVEALAYIDIINIIDIKNAFVKGLKEKNSYGFDELNKRNSPEDFEEFVKLSNAEMCLSDKYIFVIRDGRKYTEWYHTETNNNRNLITFDWQGNQLFSICLAEKVDFLAYNEQNRLLYGLSYDDGILYKYNLSKYL